MRRTPPRRLAPLALVVVLAVAGCGGDAEPAGSGTRIEVTFTGDTVAPSGERVEVAAGEEIELDVTADAPGEIHVHSTPEQELSYGAGSTTLTLTIDQPGVVEVESHDLDKVIVQLEVR